MKAEFWMKRPDWLSLWIVSVKEDILPKTQYRVYGGCHFRNRLQGDICGRTYIVQHRQMDLGIAYLPGYISLGT
jgi:hypothetical protein